MGRPREFEINDAIEKATSLFWRNGYEGTSLSDLTKAIGISPPSFYFAFGSKEGLFKKVIERYFVEQSKLAETAFRKRTPRAVATHFLNGYADVLADSLHAPGCLAMNTSLPCAAGDPLRTWLAELREQMRKRLRDRFAEARGGESLPAGMDVDSLPRLACAPSSARPIHGSPPSLDSPGALQESSARRGYTSRTSTSTAASAHRVDRTQALNSAHLSRSSVRLRMAVQSSV